MYRSTTRGVIIAVSWIVIGRCPECSKGVKCFQCNGHRHIAARCPGGRDTAEANAVIAVVFRSSKRKWIKHVELTGCSIIALININLNICNGKMLISKPDSK